MEHQTGNQLFHMYLKRTFCEENINFVEAVSKFKNLTENQADEAKKVCIYYNITNNVRI